MGGRIQHDLNRQINDNDGGYFVSNDGADYVARDREHDSGKESQDPIGKFGKCTVAVSGPYFELSCTTQSIPTYRA